MKSPDQPPLSDEEARRMARELVRLFRSPVKVFGTPGLEEPPLTIADTIRIGGTLLATLNQATGRDWLKEQNREFLVKIAELIYTPEAMEEFLYKRIKERIESAEGINEAITQIEELMSGPGAVQRFIKKALVEALPKPRRGRPTEFNPASDPERFLAVSARLSHVCDLFLSLRSQFPNKSNKELIDFLKSEDAKAVDLARKHEGFITETMSEFDFRILKTHKTRVRWLADAIAGKQLFDWSFTYAVQRAGEFRRSKEIEIEE